MTNVKQNISFADYRKMDGLNWSTLKHVSRSFEAYRHELARASDDSGGDTPSTMIGRAVHTAVLEPDEFAAEYVTYAGRRAGRAWQAFRDDHGGQTIFSPAEYDRVISMLRGVEANPAAMALLHGTDREVSINWNHADESGVWRLLKARIDACAPGILVDLKTTKDPTPAAFARQCAQLGYHKQLAMYADGYETATDQAIEQASIIAVGNTAPYECRVYHVPTEALEAGRRNYKSLLERLRGYELDGAGDELEADLILPQWALEEGEDDIELTIGGQNHAL